MKRIIVSFLLVLFIVILTSAVSVKLWSGKPEQMPENREVVINDDTTIAELGREYNLSKKALKKIFAVTDPDDFKKRVADTGLDLQQIRKKVNQAIAIQVEHKTKNWLKIPLKGGLWILFLIAVFSLLRKGKVTSQTRKVIYASANGSKLWWQMFRRY